MTTPQPETPPVLPTGDDELETAVRAAMALYLDEALALVVDGQAPTVPESLAAAVRTNQWPDEEVWDQALVAAANMGRWPDDSFWTSAVQRLVQPVVDRLYRAAYRNAAGSDAPEPRVAAWTSALLQRLAPDAWPRRVWATAQIAYIDSTSAQEPADLTDARLRDILRLDAPGANWRLGTAQLRAVAAGHDPAVPDTPEGRAAAAAELEERGTEPPEGSPRPWESDAARIARQESTCADWAAVVEASVDTQPGAMKRWISRDDSRVRPAHHDADGQTVPVADTFTVDTEALMYPGDPAASPENGINCRCEVRIVPAATVAGASEEIASMTTTTEEPTAAVTTAPSDLPFAPQDTDWDADEARAALRERATVDGELDPALYAQGFLYAPAGEDPDTYALPFATVLDGELVAVWKGVTEAAALSQVGDGDPDVVSAIRARLTELYARAVAEFDDESISPPWEAGPVRASLVAAAALDVAPVEFDGAIDVWGDDADERPPAGYFDRPEWLNGPETLPVPDGVEPFEPGKPRVVVYPDGRLVGYTATWGSCHVGFPDECVTPPPGKLGYGNFHRAPVRIADGALRLGKLTMDTGHANTGLNAAAAVTHYDNTGTLAALVRAGEDEHGIWLAGAVVPWLDGRGRSLLAMSEMSGDWRTVNGAPLQMIASLAVNHGGFIASAGNAGAEGAAPVDGKAKTDGGCGCKTSSQETAAVTAAVVDDAVVVAELDENLDAFFTALAVDSDVPDDLVAALERDLASVVAAATPAGEDGTAVTAAVVAAGENWITETGTGHLPPKIREVADALMRKGMDESRAIATAVVAARRACREGDLNFPGVQKVTANTRGEMCQAVTEWDAKRAQARMK